MRSYPLAWPKISAAVKEAAKYRCEWCRDKGSTKSKAMGMVTGHLDQNQSNCAPENLACLCRRCHNRYDSWGISPLLPKTEISRRVLFLKALSRQVIGDLRALAGHKRPKKILEWAQKVAAVSNNLRLVITILNHYQDLKFFYPAKRSRRTFVPPTWVGYMGLFGYLNPPRNQG